ncbi:efflux RND transporter periplasmic adaptor subunit [Glaciecola petra]|uniref:HlyD family efflux transporter periplasmic adaptor subunit n=1 Tax=Glaciecola petra TaxID=3075602 RepID=A0ABU2ZV33_9ALTE|nr:HlyD family efflux transporter periplasmic adaptor subunit [Aestuariibacter sp. P117]MDT0596506.1 HlyD family efflux transporter periplasmic adaptor subunit [Aestuariibacter sp. P117]
MIQDTSAQDIALESKTNMKKVIFIVIVVIGLFFLGASMLFSSPSANRSIERASVQIATLEVGDLIRDVSATGRIVAANAPQLYSPEQGYVELKVQAGDTVSIGQIVATVESPELQNQLKQERSEMERLKGQLARQELDARRQTLQLTKTLDLAEVDLQAAEREERRAQASIVNNLISQIDLEKAVDDLARAKLSFKHAKQEVALAKDTLAFELDSARSTVSRQALVIDELVRKTTDLDIRATVDGVIGNLLSQQRSLVAQNAPLMTLVDLSAYEAELNVAESYANDLSLGMPVEISIGGQKIVGQLSGISPEVTNREVTTRVRFDQQDIAGIRQNQQLSARILLENKSNVLKVRRGSFVQAGGFVAYKIEGDVATKIDIQLGARSMREVEVLSGLSANDQIIISNYDEFIESDSVLLN